MQKKYTSVVTGAAGFIGSHMVETLADAGHEVIATDTPEALEPSDPVRRLSAAVARRRASMVVPADLTAPGALDEAVKGVDFVFHAASVFNYSAPWKTLYRVNVQGTANLIDSIERAGGVRRLVVWGAGGVYGLPGRNGVELDESLPPDPPNDYLRSKWFEEFTTVDRCRRSGIPYSILRPTTVYGTRQAYGPPDILRAARRSPVIACPSNLAGRIPFVHVDDVCGAALHLAKYASGQDGIFNVNDDSGMTMVEMLRFLSQVFGKPFLRLPPVPVAPARRIVSALAVVAQEVARRTRSRPLLERDTIQYMGRDFRFSNARLKAAGYRLRHPDPKPALVEVAKWYDERGLL